MSLKKRRLSTQKGACFLCLVVSACAVGPDYPPPSVSTPARYKEAPELAWLNWKLATASDSQAQGAWWQRFADPKLNQLIATLNISNQNIAVAQAQYRQSLALLQEAQAGFMPSVDLNIGVTKARSKTNNASSVNKSYSAALIANWEIDLWGAVARQVEAGKAAVAAAYADLENARLSAQATLAVSYFQLIIANRQKRLLDATVNAYRQQLAMTENQWATGVASRADVAAAQAQLETARVAATDKGLQRLQLEHAIAILTGSPPAFFALNEHQLTPTLPVIPAQLPSTLLERRADIVAAKRRVAQANAQIGVAYAAYFPDFSLVLSGGYNSASLAQWLSIPNRVWSVGPALAQTLFNGGLSRAQTALAIAAYDQNVATYRQTVLNAFQEVEDNLAAQTILQQEAQSQRLAVSAAAESASITLNQYHAGTVSFFNVIAANTVLFSSQMNELNILNQQLTTAVGLIKSLGGDPWVAPSPAMRDKQL